MIPVSLSLQGIYSYQARQTIDFTKLTAAGIFGIFGSVGSGKSTILEAITFALYGRTDRLNLSGDNRNYNMMNLKSNEMLIEFVFRAGADKNEYMALVRSRRNSKQFDDVKACERTAYIKDHSGWIPIDVETLESIIGLSYDNFKRTVIIPQGKFQEFLLLGSKERTLMMKELFNLDRFEQYYKVASLEVRTNEQKQNIEGNLQQLGDITQEQILAIENSLIQTLKEIDEKTRELSIQQAEETKLKRLKELTEKAAMLQSQLNVLKQQESEIQSLEKKLASYEFCALNFRELINSQNSSQHKLQMVKATLDVDEKMLQDVASRLKIIETEFESIREAYDSREQIRQKAEELSKIAKILDLQERYTGFLDRIAKGEKLIAETTNSIDTLKSQQEKLLQELKNHKETLPDMSRLAKAQNWFTVNQSLTATEKDVLAEKAALLSEMEALGNNKASLFSSDSFTGISVLESYDVIISLIDEKKLHHKNAIDVLINQKQAYQVQHKLEEYASALEDGTPCPLCGSIEHPQKFNSHNLNELLCNIQNEIIKHEKLISSLEKDLKSFTEVNTVLCLKEESLKKVLQKLDENKQKQANHKSLFSWSEIKDESELASQITKAEQLLIIISKVEQELELLRVQIEKQTSQKELYTRAIGDLRTNSMKELTEANTLKAQLQIFDIADFSNVNPELLTREKEELLALIKRIEGQYQLALTQVNSLKKEQDILIGKLEVNRKVLESESLLLNSINSRIESQLNASSFNLLDEVRLILNWNLDTVKERKKITDFRHGYDLIEKQLIILNGELNGLAFDQELYDQLVQSIHLLQTEINLKNQEKGMLEANLKQMKTDFESRLKFQEALLKLNSRLEDIKTLKQLFKGNGFVKYISSVYLHELIHAANERFYKLSGQKLSLELTPENDFEVRDFMNGGKLRNVKTLSGGQTFQAALSLALALSDNTRKLSGADENFFFLDEGFGSLDKESLEIVFETLKELRHENRTVGIISHVEEMKQEIDIHLRIKNSEDLGSMIEKSWES